MRLKHEFFLKPQATGCKPSAAGIYTKFRTLFLIIALLFLSSLACNAPATQPVPDTATSEPAPVIETLSVTVTQTEMPVESTSTSTPDPVPTVEIQPTTTWTAPVEGYVILTNIQPNDPYYAAVARLQAYRDALVLSFDDDISTVKADLNAGLIRFAAVMVKPEDMDEDLAFAMFQLAKEVDTSFDTDFAYGFITGINPADTLQYVENVVAYELGHSELVPEFAVAWRTGPGSVSGGLEGFADEKTSEALTYFEQLDFEVHRVDMDELQKEETLAALSQAGVLFFFQHGAPYMLECGVNCSGDAIMAADIPQFSALFIFSSACYGGSVSAWYSQNQEPPSTYVERVQQSEPAEAIALNFLRNGALGYYGHMCMWGSNTWPLHLMAALVQNPQLTTGELIASWYDVPQGPSIIQDSPAADINGMDQNRFYYAAMVLYGDPAVRILQD